MYLPSERAGRYLAALKSGLNALAPNLDFVPLREGIAHLTVLDPSVSGPLFAPAEWHDQSGMPSFVWMERVLAEQTVALERSPEQDDSDTDIARALSLDKNLGERLRWRRQTHRQLRGMALLPRTRLEVVLKRLKGETVVTTTFDRMAPLGGWVRIRLDLSAPAGQTIMGPIRLKDNRRLIVDPGFEHLLTRHSDTPFLALREALEEVTPASTIPRLSRSRLGPFWFPGVTLPKGVPDALGQGLLLHSQLQVLAKDVATSDHADPLTVPNSGPLPPGFGLFQQRRFAASSSVKAAIESWCEVRGVRCGVVVF
jgi:hypothetical protein